MKEDNEERGGCAVDVPGRMEAFGDVTHEVV
jgi:hypothetical protein